MENDNIKDRKLMLKYQAGDHMAFNALYERHSDKIYSYLARRVHDQNQLDDIYQKVFVKLHKSRHLYNEKYEVLPWLYTITKTVFLDAIKKKQIETTEFEENIHSPENETSVERFDIASEKSLTEKEKMALQNRYINEKDFSEISELLETSESNVRKIISRALKKLKTKYQGAKS